MDFQTLVSGTGGVTSNGNGSDSSPFIASARGCTCPETGCAGCASRSCGFTETGLDVGTGSPGLTLPTDPYSAYAQYGAQALDILSGGPKQREREARAMRDAALAAERTAVAQLAAAREARAAAEAAASAPAPSYPTRSGGTSLALGSVGGGGTGFRRTVPGLGVPVWQLLLAAGVTAGVVLWPR